MLEMEKALEKIDHEEIAHDTPEYTVRQIVGAWLRYSPEDAAARVLDETKSIAKCYQHVRSCAKKLGKQEVNAAAEKEVGWVMDYYGIPAEKAQEILEGGLMCAVLQAMAATWQPYGKPKETPRQESIAPNPAEGELDLSSLL